LSPLGCRLKPQGRGAGTRSRWIKRLEVWRQRAWIKRSDFGVTKYVPLIGDEVHLMITAAFEKQG